MRIVGRGAGELAGRAAGAAPADRYLSGFYRMPGDTPQLENELQPVEMIVQISAHGAPGAAGSHYLKVRERASYEFAVVSVAAVVHAPGGVIALMRASR